MVKFNHNTGYIKCIYATKVGFYPRNWEIHISHHLLNIRNPFLKIQILNENTTWGLVLVSCGCCNKLSQTGWLKTSEICSLTALETRNLKSVLLDHKQGVGRITLSPEALGENLFLASFINLITFAKTPFPYKVTFTGSTIRTLYTWKVLFSLLQDPFSIKL